jgi:hypothetical protein
MLQRCSNDREDDHGKEACEEVEGKESEAGGPEEKENDDEEGQGQEAGGEEEGPQGGSEAVGPCVRSRIGADARDGRAIDGLGRWRGWRVSGSRH